MFWANLSVRRTDGISGPWSHSITNMSFTLFQRHPNKNIIDEVVLSLYEIKDRYSEGVFVLN